MAAAAFILLYGLSYGLVLCLIALGLVVTMGLMRVINLAHGAFAAIGGYLAITPDAAGRPRRMRWPFPRRCWRSPRSASSPNACSTAPVRQAASSTRCS